MITQWIDNEKPYTPATPWVTQDAPSDFRVTMFNLVSSVTVQSKK